MEKVSSSLETCILGKVQGRGRSREAVGVEGRGRTIAAQKQRLKMLDLDVCFLLVWLVQTSFNPCLKK